MDESGQKQVQETPPEAGACHNCGFLCTQIVGGPARLFISDERADFDPDALPVFTELSRVHRQTNHFFRVQKVTLRNQPGFVFTHRPACFLDVDILSELDYHDWTVYPYAIQGDTDLAHMTLSGFAGRTITRARKCDLWMRYQPGLGPETHLGSKALSDLEAARRAFELRVEQQRQTADRQLEVERRRSVEANEAIRAEQERRNRRFDVRLGFAAVALGVMQILTAGPDSLFVQLWTHVQHLLFGWS
jgi:hypothetical protein